MILGSGPNRIGQGIEFDYCCVHAAMTVRESGRDAVMVNCNPETVSTDYDTSDRLYFEPLTLEDVLGIVEVEQPEGVIVQFGGQTPLKLAAGLHAAGVPLLGHERRGDRPRRGPQPLQRAARATSARRRRRTRPRDSRAEALAAAPERRLPAARAPELRARRPRDGGRLLRWRGSQDYLDRVRPEGRIFLDRFMENAIEVDVDALCDGEDVWIGGIMQHVEEAGIHSGDSACVLPPHSLGGEALDQIRALTRDIALALGVVGLMNVQYALYEDDVYVIEANPRASRTVPFVSKATGVPLAKMACRVMLGERIADLGLPGRSDRRTTSASRRRCCRSTASTARDGLLGPEMRSTGEVMGVAHGLPDRVRQGPGRGRRRAARERHRLPHRHRRRQARRGRHRRACCTTAASTSSPRAAPRARSRAWASRWSG